jgi:phage protein D
MSSALARRTVIAVAIDGADISEDANKYLISLSYTDNEEDKADDLQLSLDDREGVWLTNWLDSADGTKGAEISAVIIQKNWESNGNDRVLDCGKFEVDTLDGTGFPASVAIKGTSLPFSSVVRTAKHTKAWEKITLAALAGEMAGRSGMSLMYESSYNPLYDRKEQVELRRQARYGRKTPHIGQAQSFAKSTAYHNRKMGC